jgi:hypothetical protein
MSVTLFIMKAHWTLTIFSEGRRKRWYFIKALFTQKKNDMGPVRKPWILTQLNLNRRQEVIITRLRTDHSNLTHSHLLAKENPPACNTCDTYITIKHVLTDCRKFSAKKKSTEFQSTSKQHSATAASGSRLYCS